MKESACVGTGERYHVSDSNFGLGAYPSGKAGLSWAPFYYPGGCLLLRVVFWKLSRIVDLGRCTCRLLGLLFPPPFVARLQGTVFFFMKLGSKVG